MTSLAKYGPKRLPARAILAVAVIFASRSAHAVEQKYWGETAYQVQIELAVDARLRPETDFAERLASALLRRIDAAVGPLWKTNLTVTAGVRRADLLRSLPATPWEDTPAEIRQSDKLLLLAVAATPQGWQIRTREFDSYLRRWNPVATTTVQQRRRLEEACFQALFASFSPLAEVRVIEGNDERVELLPRGHDLPLRGGRSPFFSSGMPLLPILRRSDRSGELLENGVVPLPWTYLSATEPQGDHWLADVHTGVRRPFRARRRGQVEQLAVGLSPRDAATIVRFYAREDKSIGLAGYEVFRKTSDGGTELVGVTDRHGEIEIPRSAEAIATLFLRSDGQLLAKIPVAPGAEQRLEAPIADDAARLRAQAELRTVREDLIDLVARRAILIGRARNYLETDRLKDAQQLMSELGKLPGVAQFSRQISLAERGNSSADASVQKRISTMFDDTRSLLAKFLSPKPINDLQAQINQARNSATN
ncbi:MAG: hypothetical protein CMJ58_18315 [Planctomycetaceae bacterium]|nr:hypothetical protein [Planctomycetaceae bacterium]